VFWAMKTAMFSELLQLRLFESATASACGWLKTQKLLRAFAALRTLCRRRAGIQNALAM
jgi:hypothetical protein